MEIQDYASGRTALVAGGQKINLRPVGAEGWRTAAQDTPGALDICFLTETPVSQVIAAWHAAGIKIQAGPVQRSGARGAITSVYTQDPDGNLIEVANYNE